MTSHHAPGTRSNSTVRVENSPEDVARQAAEIFARLAKQAAGGGKPLRVALSGGSTPKLIYQLLSGGPLREEVSWGNIQFFFGDERWVPPTSVDSNYKLANDGLLQPLDISRDHIFPMPTENVEPQEAAAEYEATIRQAFGLREGELPSFDLIFLGMGDDGHTASLFPHTEALHETQKLVTANWVEKFNTWRITLTAPVLTAAQEVLFMITGAGKAPALRQVLEGGYNPEGYPSQLLRNAEGHVTWLLDKAAASQLDNMTS